jgi:hypothetical protein
LIDRLGRQTLFISDRANLTELHFQFGHLDDCAVQGRVQVGGECLILIVDGSGWIVVCS